MRKIMQHRFLALLAMLMISLVSLASQPQGRKHHDGFDPKRFQAELEQFITTNACLTPREAAKFFPVYRQMGKKMRMIFDEMRRFRHVNPNDNEACAEAIRRQDELDIQLKQLQQEGKLKNVGKPTQPIYRAMPGYYGVSRDAKAGR